MFLPSHGGELTAASVYWQRPIEQWLDLSTGINPYVYPLAEVPQEVWQNLPYGDYGLTDAASRYFQRRINVVVPGSQFAIEQIPRLLKPAAVAVPKLGYSEYNKAWQAAGHIVHGYSDLAHLQSLLRQGEVSHCVLINPNNPCATEYSRDELNDVLRYCQGYCLLDEAFRDLTPHLSALAFKHERLIVLRSLGKFFGLAGARIGFVFADAFISQGLKQALGLWPVSAPSLWAASVALSDETWQQKNRNRIKQLSTDLERLLRQYLSADWRSAGLFVSARFEKAKACFIYEQLAQQGILIRYFDLPNDMALLRFGLPKIEQIERIESALGCIEAQ